MYSFCTYNLEPCLMGFGYTVQAIVKTIYFMIGIKLINT